MTEDPALDGQDPWSKPSDRHPFGDEHVDPGYGRDEKRQMCGKDRDTGYCTMAGSEWCEFECPYRSTKGS